MSEIPDLTRLGALPFWLPSAEPPTALPLVAVGWLEATVPSQGETPDDVIERLVETTRSEHVFGDHSRGFHLCALCTDAAHRPRERWRGQEVELFGHGFQLVEHQDQAFVFPRLLLHYILSHGYRPPDAALAAIRHGRFLRPPPPTADELAAIERQRQAQANPPTPSLRFDGIVFGLALVALFGAVLWKLLTAR